jgi:hypothetical protein
MLPTENFSKKQNFLQEFASALLHFQPFPTILHFQCSPTEYCEIVEKSTFKNKKIFYPNFHLHQLENHHFSIHLAFFFHFSIFSSLALIRFPPI